MKQGFWPDSISTDLHECPFNRLHLDVFQVGFDHIARTEHLAAEGEQCSLVVHVGHSEATWTEPPATKAAPGGLSHCFRCE